MTRSEGLVSVTLMLDWVPNTNHTGIYVAQELGLFRGGRAGGRDRPARGGLPRGGGRGRRRRFRHQLSGVVTLARAEGAPIVSIAAVMQHNTSGFASLAESGRTESGRLRGAALRGVRFALRSPHAQGPDGCAGRPTSTSWR